MPSFIRGGKILPIKERVRRASSLMARDPYTLIIALDSEVSKIHKEHGMAGVFTCPIIAVLENKITISIKLLSTVFLILSNHPAKKRIFLLFATKRFETYDEINFHSSQNSLTVAPKLKV